MYIWLIGLHVTAVTLWILGMSAAAILISALDATTAAEPGPARLLRAAYRWERRVTSPAMGLAWLLGITLVVVGGWGFEPWLVAKVIIVTALSALHGKLAAGLRRLGQADARPVSPLLRFSPLAVIAGAIAIVTLVVVKPY
ncbi:CopD family protein [Azospirillum endophyticum]|uniref:CopD family protein n=1 Tax=Azospirillum endophyticum TaxID=2800326 RepID=UPI0031F3047F